MLRSSTRTFLLATCIAAAPAFALAQSSAPQHNNQAQQSNQRSASQSSGKFLNGPHAGQMRAADLREADVYTEDNQKIGDIDDILLDRQGKIIGVVVGVGGFLGIGEKNVAIPFDALTLEDRNAVAANDRNSSRSGSTTTTTTTRSTASNANERAANSNADRIATGNVPDNRASTDQDRQRTTAQRAEQMSNEQANRQANSNNNQRNATTTTTTRETNQRTADATMVMFKPERILLKGITKADLQNAPEFHWDDSGSRSRSNTSNAPARNR